MGSSNVSDFAAWLAEREAALGLKPTRPQPTPQPTPAAQPSEPAEPEPVLDRFGNTIIGGASGIGPQRQYRIIAARDGRTLRVCGEAASDKHLLLWTYDADERRYVCRLCWPEHETTEVR